MLINQLELFVDQRTTKIQQCPGPTRRTIPQSRIEGANLVPTALLCVVKREVRDNHQVFEAVGVVGHRAVTQTGTNANLVADQ